MSNGKSMPDDHGQNVRGTTGKTGKLAIRYGARLPHWAMDGAIYAVNFRLGDSVSQKLLKQWETERAYLLGRAAEENPELSKQEKERIEFLFSEKVEAYLDAGYGACWMKKPEIADLVENSLLFFDEKRYCLHVWCVMPNHVHAIVEPLSGNELPEILHSWKSFTSKEANKLLGRKGTFWQVEYYDHLIRNEEDYRNQVAYVLNNPEKAGLKDWKWVGVKQSHERPAHGCE